MRAAFADAAALHPRIVQIEGPAGVGKTALIERFLADPESEQPPTVLRAGGDEAEALLAYGVVEQLVRSAGLEPAAVTGAAGPLDDPVTVGTRLLGLFDRDDEAAVVVIVDDAHWADRPSLSALLFALRRLVADPVLVLIGVRDAVIGLPEGLRRLVDGQQGTAITLSGLGEPELRDLAAQLGSPLSPVAARRLRDGTRGNPLHARALLAEFPAQWWGTGSGPCPRHAPSGWWCATAGRAAPSPPATSSTPPPCSACTARFRRWRRSPGWTSPCRRWTRPRPQGSSPSQGRAH